MALAKVDFDLFSSLCYSGRLEIFELETLQQRRLIIDLVECFKIVKGIHCDPLFAGLFELGNRHGLSRRGPFILRQYSVSSKAACGFFFNRVQKLWNSLPPHFREISSLPMFKSSIARIDLSSL